MKKKTMVKILGMSFLIGSTITMIHTWFLAWNNESKTVLVGIDWYGEAVFEAWMIVVFIPLIIISLFLMVWNNERLVQ